MVLNPEGSTFQPHTSPRVWHLSQGSSGGCTLCFSPDVYPAFFLLGYFENSTVTPVLEVKRSSETPGGLRKHFFNRIIFRNTQLFKEQIPDFLQAARHSTRVIILSFSFFSHSSGIMGLRRFLLAILKITPYFPVPLFMWQRKPTCVTERAQNIYLLHLLTPPTVCKLPYYYFLINNHPSLSILFDQFRISSETRIFNNSFSLPETGLLKQLTGGSH